ncbi:MAG: cytochrome b/b6 domain-containing protein [Burkholderiales bacterium]
MPDVCGKRHTKEREEYAKSVHGRAALGGKNGAAAVCSSCHTTHDVADPAKDDARYPAIWLASKFLLVMIAGAFVFFWSHTALWFYREYQDRKARVARPQVRTAGLGEARFLGKQYQRFPVAWRMAHLLFALSLMMLVMTGMSVLYAGTPWAQAIINALGGPKVAAVIHRTFAVLFLVVFVGHLGHLVVHAAQRRGSFDWLGPDSLAPRAQDLRDILAMFRWFIGRGPRPVFDRWTYWQKFDYWAPFSGGAHRQRLRPDAVGSGQDPRDPAGLGAQHRHDLPRRDGGAGGAVPFHRALLQQSLQARQVSARARDVHRLHAA